MVYQMEPFGDYRDDLRMARLAWATLQAGNKKTLKETDFLFSWKHNERPLTPQDYKAKAMRAWTGGGGGLIVKPSG